MTIVSFPNKVKYRGVYIDPHTPFEVEDSEKDEMLKSGAHLIQYVPPKPEKVEEPEGDEEPEKVEEVLEGDSGATEPVPDGGEEIPLVPDEDDSFDDEEDLPDEPEQPIKPVTRRKTK